MARVPITWPVHITFDGFLPIISSSFDSHLRRSPPSRTPGVDIIYKDKRAGEPVITIAPGVVLRSGVGLTGGFVTIQHPGGLQTTYRHLKDLTVEKGNLVVTGQKLGKMSFNPLDPEKVPHVHLEAKIRGQFLDPGVLLKVVPPTRGGQKPRTFSLEFLQFILKKALEKKTTTFPSEAVLWILILLALSRS